MIARSVRLDHGQWIEHDDPTGGIVGRSAPEVGELHGDGEPHRHSPSHHGTSHRTDRLSSNGSHSLGKVRVPQQFRARLFLRPIRRESRTAGRRTHGAAVNRGEDLGRGPRQGRGGQGLKVGLGPHVVGRGGSALLWRGGLSLRLSGKGYFT